MNSMRFAWFCAFFAHGCFNPGSGSNPADTDTDTDSVGTMSDSMGTGSAVTSVTNSSMTSEPTTTSPTSPTDASESVTTGPETDSVSVSESDSDTQTGTSGAEPQCGDGIPVATELCFDDTPVTYEVDPGAVDVGVGDISANGLLGIVVLHTNGNMGALTLLEADGVGGFVEGNSQTAPAYGGRVRVTDVDGDDDADIFAIGSDGLRFYRNEAAFFLDDDAPSFFGGSGDVAEVLVTDINGDGVFDVLASQAYAHTWYRGVMNGGNWAFDATFNGLPTPGEGAAGMIAGAFSFDGDDDVDVVALNQYYSSVEVLTNDGAGTFANHSTPAVCAGIDGVRFGEAADFDGDGNTDFVAACVGGDLGVAFDDGTGTFPTFDTLALAGAYRPTVADLDDDGAPDILVTSTTLMRAVIFRNDGTGAFALSDTQFMGTGPVRGAAAADLNDDGALDVVVASGGPSSQVDVYFAMP